MARPKKWEIKNWNCEKQCFDAPRQVTLAQYRAEVDAACAKAKAIHATQVSELKS